MSSQDKLAYIVRCLIAPILGGLIMGAMVVLRPDILHERVVLNGTGLWLVLVAIIGLSICGGCIYIKSRWWINFVGTAALGIPLGLTFGNFLYFMMVLAMMITILAVSAKIFPFSFQKK